MNTETFTAHTKDVGGIPVARLLPQRARTIGAWRFLDHAGPAPFWRQIQKACKWARNRTPICKPSPGCSKAKCGTRQLEASASLCAPAKSNLMTAGTGSAHGIAHTERNP